MKGIKKIHIIFLLLTLDVLSCTGSKKENSYKAAVKQSNVSNLKFDNDYYDFGDISLGQKVFHDFYFINNSKIPLILYDVSSSCGCTVPTWPKKSVLPGHKNYIRIVYQSISDPANRDSSAYKLNYTPARTNSELIAIRNTPKANIIRTLADFDRIASTKQTPLSILPENVLNDLRRSLVIRENVGIVGLNYAIIQKSLSKEDFHIIMSLFGLDTKMGFWGFSDDAGIKNMTKVECQDCDEDYKEYRCSAPHNCERSSDNICLTGC